MKGNFEEALRPLASVFSEVMPTDELQKFHLIVKINEYFQPEKDKNYPCIQLWDVSHYMPLPRLHLI